ncbi:hypothetical protein [Rhodococcus globerulus]|uniref:Tail assembly chaperone n=1 Tax=Rhodococcus globerulus TaxID=33008 RepID=A0ABU4C4B3_RHOGO|nr:hypothetical protein [Rhodococcus globerulus]MDV6271106.1 hypothetical protein [Rhodococcus globerulus]
MPAHTDFDSFGDHEDETGDADVAVAAAELKLAKARAARDARAAQAEQDDAEYDEPDEIAAAPVRAQRPGLNRAQRRQAERVKKTAPKLEQSTGRENEAVSDTLEFDFNGVTYTAPIAGRTRGLVNAMEQESVRLILLSIIGQEQYENFLETDPYDSEYMELFRAWSRAAGFKNLGN